MKKTFTKTQTQRIRTAQDLGDLFAYVERWGDDVAYTFPESEQERINALMLGINYKQGEYNADNIKRIIGGDYYRTKQEEARRKAQALQVYQGAMSWEDVAEQCAELERLGKRYGLLKEFRSEGVL